jgi:N-acetylglucosamine-6-phosphate deacetylase
MAGSALSMNRAVAVFSDFSGANLTDAIQAASTNPGRVLRREGVCIDLAADQPANLVVFRTDPNALRIEGVLLQGRQVFASNGWHLPS